MVRMIYILDYCTPKYTFWRFDFNLISERKGLYMAIIVIFFSLLFSFRFNQQERHSDFCICTKRIKHMVGAHSHYYGIRNQNINDCTFVSICFVCSICQGGCFFVFVFVQLSCNYMVCFLFHSIGWRIECCSK